MGGGGRGRRSIVRSLPPKKKKRKKAAGRRREGALLVKKLYECCQICFPRPARSREVDPHWFCSQRSVLCGKLDEWRGLFQSHQGHIWIKLIHNRDDDE